MLITIEKIGTSGGIKSWSKCTNNWTVSPGLYVVSIKSERLSIRNGWRDWILGLINCNRERNVNVPPLGVYRNIVSLEKSSPS